MSTTRGEGPPPRIAIRAYDGCKDAQELDRRVGAHLLATLRAMPGFRGYSTADLGEGRVACISLLDSAANAANDHALVQRFHGSTPITLPRRFCRSNGG